MTGTWAYVTTNGSAFFVAYSKDGNSWWAGYNITPASWTAFKGDPQHGNYWNVLIYAAPFAPTLTWADYVGSSPYGKGMIGFPPFPGTDSFTV